MDQTKMYSWSELPEDTPIPLLARRKIETDRMLVAQIQLAKGCDVSLHSHPSEQVSVILSGRLRWTVEDSDGAQRIVETGAGELLVIPAGSLHAALAVEDTVAVDILSPPGRMGVDDQREAGATVTGVASP